VFLSWLVTTPTKAEKNLGLLVITPTKAENQEPRQKENLGLLVITPTKAEGGVLEKAECPPYL